MQEHSGSFISRDGSCKEVMQKGREGNHERGGTPKKVDVPHASGTGVRGSAPGLHVTPHHEPCGDLRPQRLAPGTPQRDAPGDHAVWRRLRPARQDAEEGTQVRKPHLPQERQAVHVTRRLTDWRDLRPCAVH